METKKIIIEMTTKTEVEIQFPCYRRFQNWFYGSVDGETAVKVKEDGIYTVPVTSMFNAYTCNRYNNSSMEDCTQEDFLNAWHDTDNKMIQLSVLNFEANLRELPMPEDLDKEYFEIAELDDDGYHIEETTKP